MKRSLIAGLLLGLLTFGTQPATAAPLGEELQTVVGTIAAPTRSTDGEGGFPGLGRRLWLLSPATNGSVMFVLDIDSATWGGQFVIDSVTDATGSGDMDIYLYQNLGSAEFPGATDVLTLAEYDTGGPGETGFIPFGTKRAIVFTPNAVQSTFTYHGFSMPTISIASGGDITIPSGGFVGWVNDTNDYSFVRHNKANPAFNLFCPDTCVTERSGHMCDTP